MRNTSSNRRGSLLMLCCAVMCLTGCGITSDGPFIDPQSGWVDTRILGVWTHVETDPTTHATVTRTYTIGRGGTGSPAGMMTENESSYDSAKGESTPGTLGYFDATTIQNYYYMSVFDDPSPTRTSQACHIVRYSINGDELDIWSGSDTAETDLIKRGLLTGIVTSDGTTSTTTATAASLVQYLRSNAGFDLFPASAETVYHRTTGTASALSSPPATTPPVTSTQPVATTPPVNTTPPVTTSPSPATDTSVSTSNSSSVNIVSMLPWIILVFIAGIFAAKKFGQKS